MVNPAGPDPWTPTSWVTANYALMRRRAERYFRGVRCQDRRADLACEAIALWWLYAGRLHRQGRPWHLYPCKLLTFACHHVRRGDRLKRDTFAVGPRSGRTHDRELWDHVPHSGSAVLDRIADHKQLNPAALGALAMDWRAWAATLTHYQEWVLERMAEGFTRAELAHYRGVSREAVDRLVRKLGDRWEYFQL